MSVSVVLTSCGRPELLSRTLRSFFLHNTYPIEQFIIVEDSGKPELFDAIKSEYPDMNWIFNKENIGQIPSIVKGYAQVKSDYVFHMEDDWEFTAPGFIEASLPALEYDPKILQVWIRGSQDTNGHPVQGMLKLVATSYGKMKLDHNGWHGFSFNPGLKRMADYIPYHLITKHTGQSNSGAEREIGEHYFKQGFYAVTTLGSFVKHIGWKESTRQKRSIWTLDDARGEHHHSPRLAEQLCKIIPKNKPVIDLGCGKGTYLKRLSEAGYDCHGFEGTEGIEQIADYSPIIQADLSKPLETNHKGTVICLEVAEHIPAQYESILIDNIDKACDGLLILSWAVKGQGGHGHFNEQNGFYVRQLFKSRGYKHNMDLSIKLRRIAGIDLWWFKNTIYVFQK